MSSWKNNRLVAWAIATPLVFTVSGMDVQADALAGGPKFKAPSQIELKAEAFSLTQVGLLDGPFRQAMELDRQYLLSLDPGRLLHTFRLNAGLPSTAQPLGGWEEPKCEVRGHFLGHYLSACARMFASTGDEALKAKGRAVVAGLGECQAKLGSGYLSAYPEEFIDRVEAQQRVWAPYYTLHKIYAGLMDMYVYCDDAQALEICRRFADWVITRNGRLSDEQMQKMLGNEHGGMNETLANLYGLTGEKKYLDISLRFNHAAVIGPASQRQDKLTGLHANTQIPKFVGTARQYELTRQEALRTASTFFWDTVVHERSYVIGGHSDGEMFSAKERLSEALGPNTTETCNTYNMLKLTRHLFCWDPKAEYADYYERALYNHILASQDPATGMMCYYVPLRPGSRKNYCTPTSSFWCCTGTGVENHAQYGDSIYFHHGLDTLYINLFIASELDWKERGLKLRQETTYPHGEQTSFLISCDRPVNLELKLRCPSWATEGFQVKLNGKTQSLKVTRGTYLSLARSWHDGDRLDLVVPLASRTEGFRDNPRRFAFLAGPLVLCAEVEAGQPMPVLVGTGPARLNRLPGQDAWDIQGLQTVFPGATGRPVKLEPFYKMHGNRHYTVYFDQHTPEEWEAKKAALQEEQARQKELERRTVDVVNPGQEQNERDHNLKGAQTASGDFGGRKWRHATDGGWFSWELKVQPGTAQLLSVSYWGSDGGNRVFDIQVDGVRVATERLEGKRPDRFFDQTYALPTAVLEGKEKVTIRFQAHPGSWAGGVFGCRILKP